MSDIAIKVENLSKAYQLGQIGSGTISRDLERWYARVRGKEDPLLQVGESNDQNTKSESNVVWSLKDINLEITKGEAVGIIGKNGAGKSTLLKILSKVTAPTTGKISGSGRIASLLEVGTGFHPELSGRENIFLNGAILGMRKREIQRKLDEIVDFAGIERYLDTPVKRYSSGMYVRLAFAVAAHLESEILIVDEVLAVGDAEFQKKCLGKMGEVSNGQGRTVLFVSHNIMAIKMLCDKVILFNNGTNQFVGDVSAGYKLYQENVKKNIKIEHITEADDNLLRKAAYISKIKMLNAEISSIANNEILRFEIELKSNKKIINNRIGIRISSSDNIPIGLLFSKPNISIAPLGTQTIILELNNHNLAKGFYNLDFSIGEGDEQNAIIDYHIIEAALSFEISKKYFGEENLNYNWQEINWGNHNYNQTLIKIK